MSKRGLGRGLSALIPSAGEDEVQDVREVPVDQISPNPRQPRTALSDDGVAELADSISKVGVLQPVMVRPHADGYQIIAGERRWRAARMAGLERVPVRVLSIGEAESLELALIENLQREDLNPIEEARGFRRLLTEHQMTQAELADKVSKSRSAVTNALRLLDLPEEVQGHVYEGRLSAGHARAILAVPDEEMRIRLAEKVVAEGQSVRETEALARLYAAGQAERAPRPRTPKSFKIVARKLRRMLGTGVRVRQTSKKGKIEIEFHGEDELERIYRLLTDSGASEMPAKEA
ncbi:MAG TPA: ParB/RepB/Spo0J family partition protein [Coriobacteriia bacterium]|nr:ParB/RepB/Spo0J family partition protein [Coriobacteriia bacterium]